MDIVTYALCKKFALKVAAGFSSVTVDEPTSTINFTLNDGNKVSLKIPQLRGIKNIETKDVVNPTTGELEEHLVFLMTDDTYVDIGKFPGGSAEISKEKGNQLKSKKDGLYVGSNIKRLTKEQYDALPEEEKKNPEILYFVTDDSEETGVLIAVSAEEGNALVRKKDGYYVSKTGIKVSPEETNILQDTEEGLYVPGVKSEEQKQEILDLIKDNIETEDIDFSDFFN